MSTPSPDAYGRYTRVRDEIIHEDNLIGARVNWFLTSQAFLLSALAIAHTGGADPPGHGNNFFYPLLPILGLASSGLIFFGVLAGIAVLIRWRRLLTTEFADPARFPAVGRDGWIIAGGWSSPIALPLLFGGAWVYLLLRGL